MYYDLGVLFFFPTAELDKLRIVNTDWNIYIFAADLVA